MTGLWFRVRIWYANRLLDIAEWLEKRKRLKRSATPRR